MSESISSLNEIIDRGMKIYHVDEGNGKIQIIEGIEIKNGNTEVLVSSYKLDLTEEFKNYIQSDKFQNALFKPTKRGIILIDIAGYSKGNTLYQASALSIFNQVIKLSLSKSYLLSNKKNVEQIVPTGDGCYIVFNESINDRFFRIIFMIVSQMNVIQNRVLMKFNKKPSDENKFHIRVGCTLNEVDIFHDASGHINCYGIGMNEAARILNYGYKEVKEKYNDESIDTIFIDESVYDQAKSLVDWIKSISQKGEIIDLGEISDKHDMKRNIWWIKNLPKNLAIHLYSLEESIGENNKI